MKVGHYEQAGFETIGFIEEVVSFGRFTPFDGYLVGNALKYAQRAGKKGDWEVDAKKCADYLHRAIYGFWVDEPHAHVCSECAYFDSNRCKRSDSPVAPNQKACDSIAFEF